MVKVLRCGNSCYARTPKAPKQPVIKIEPGTLILIVSALILLPLLITGFLGQ